MFSLAFAKIENGIVVNIIDASLEFIRIADPSGKYVQAWEDANGNIAKRVAYPNIGDTYDDVNDVFITQSPFASWVLNPTTFLWEAPTPMPTDGKQYAWDEATLSWIELVAPSV